MTTVAPDLALLIIEDVRGALRPMGWAVVNVGIWFHRSLGAPVRRGRHDNKLPT
jgi:hypothetical protein